MLLIYKTNLICLKQLSEAGPGLLLFAACRSGRLHCGQIFSLFFSSYQTYLSDSHKQRGWVESDSVWYLSFDQTFVSVRQTGLGLGLFASKRKPEYSHPLNKILSVLVIRIKCFEIGYRKHFPQKKMHTFAFTKSWICLFGICVLFLNIFVHSEYQGVIGDENYDGFDVLFTNCTKSVWRAPIVYRGPVWETMGVSIKGGIDHDSISTAILSRDGGHSPSRCSALQQNAQFEQNKTKVQCNQMHQFEQNAMQLKFTFVPPCFALSRDYFN